MKCTISIQASMQAILASLDDTSRDALESKVNEALSAYVDALNGCSVPDLYIERIQATAEGMIQASRQQRSFFR